MLYNIYHILYYITYSLNVVNNSKIITKKPITSYLKSKNNRTCISFGNRFGTPTSVKKFLHFIAIVEWVTKYVFRFNYTVEYISKTIRSLLDI